MQVPNKVLALSNLQHISLNSLFKNNNHLFSWIFIDINTRCDVYTLWCEWE